MTLKRDDVKNIRQRKYVSKDFDGLRALLLEYARLYYPDRIRDFSESSFGGLMLDFAAYVGDNLSFYLDHQYSELSAETAVETVNIERLLRSSGIDISGAAPAVVRETAYVQIPASTVNNVTLPSLDSIPVILAGSTILAENGTNFILIEDIDFNKKRSDGSYVAEIRVGSKTPSGTPLTFIMASDGLCISGTETTENFTIGSTFEPFRKITLSNANVTDIVNVTDSLGNTYYKVGALTHDVVYKNVLNTAKDSDLVKDAIKVIPAPYRYTAAGDLATRKTTLTFGGGSASSLDDDVIPDPADFAISFPYTKTFSRLAVNPEQLLQTKTLGVAATNVTLSITYRYGGGLSHNAPAGTIKNINTINVFFPGNPLAGTAAAVKGSIEVTNKKEAAGGDDALTPEELTALVPSIRNSQERIVTRPDLLARVYSIPSNFGRVFRAAIRSNSNNPLATQLFIVSRTPEQQLTTSPDTLKQNLKAFLNPYRMISDAIDVLDAKIVNLSLSFSAVIDPSLNKSIVLQSALVKLQSLLDIKNFHIDQPIVLSDVTNTIFTVPGIISVDRISFENISGIVNNREYSSATFDVSSNTRQGIIFPPEGGIFEIRFPDVDILGKAVV